MWTHQWDYAPNCGFYSSGEPCYEHIGFVQQPDCGTFLTASGQQPTYWPPQFGNALTSCHFCNGPEGNAAFYATPQTPQIPYASEKCVSSADSQPITQQIESLNRGIAKYLRLADEEKSSDPEFSEWCLGTAEELMSCRDLLMYSESTMYESVGQPENILIVKSQMLPIVEEQRVLGLQRLNHHSDSQVPRNDMSYLEPTEILAKNMEAVIDSCAKDIDSERQEASLITADHSELIGTTGSNTLPSSEQTPIESSEIRPVIPISLKNDSEFCPKSVVHFPLLRQLLSEGVDVKWSKRRFKVSLDRKSGSNCGLNDGTVFGDNLRSFRWTKRRMKGYFGHGKFGQGFGGQDQSRTIGLFRGSGGVNRRKGREKEGKDTDFDEGMMKWAEERMSKWREGSAVRNATSNHLDKAETGPRRGNSKFDRDRKCSDLALEKVGKSAFIHGHCSSGPYALKGSRRSLFITSRPFG